MASGVQSASAGPMLRLLAVLAFGLCACMFRLPAAAQAPDPARVSAAREMMELAGVAKQFDELMPLLAQQLSQSFMAVAPDKAEEIRQVFAQLPGKFIDRKGELIEQVAALYAQELNVEELGAVCAFYKSPVGAKLLSVQPKIARQSIVLGQRWGAEIGRELEQEARKELKKRGIEL
jgi:uncharacterized protein